MPNWLQLDPQRLSQTEDQERKGWERLVPDREGVNVEISLSPYDIPEAARGRYDEEHHRFVIEFKYIEDEPWKRISENEAIHFRVGKNSGRLYGIEIDIDKASADPESRLNVLPTVVGNAMVRLQREKPNQAREGNYRLANQVIEEYQNELFADAR